MEKVYTLSLYGQGVVTLPKAWREKTGARKFIAREHGDQLILEPMTQETNLRLITENPSFDFLKNEPDLYS
jgi:virulence-associated protein VagC